MKALRRRLRRHQGGDAGFTLIEMLLCTVILGVIALPLGNFMIAYFQNLPTTLSTVSDSHDMQITAAYFSQDVANLGTRSYALPADPGTGAAQISVWIQGSTFQGSYCGKGAGTTMVLFEWDKISATLSGSPPATSTQREIDSAAYVVESGTLHRLFCPGVPVGGIATATPGTHPALDATLVHNLHYPDPTGDPTPVTCSSTCSSTTWPASVSMKLSIKTSTDKSPVYATLTGNRRQT